MSFFRKTQLLNMCKERKYRYKNVSNKWNDAKKNSIKNCWQLYVMLIHIVFAPVDLMPVGHIYGCIRPRYIGCMLW